MGKNESATAKPQCPIYSRDVVADEKGVCSSCEGRIDKDGNCTTLLSEHEIFERTKDIINHDSFADKYKIQDIQENFGRLDTEQEEPEVTALQERLAQKRAMKKIKEGAELGFKPYEYLKSFIVCTDAVTGGRLKRDEDYVDFNGFTWVGQYEVNTKAEAIMKAWVDFKRWDFSAEDIENLSLQAFELANTKAR